MAKRHRIGIPFLYNEEWIAGSYYIKNLIESLRLLEDSLVPELFVLSWDKKDFEFIKKSGYPYIHYLPFDIPYGFFERAINKVSRVFTGKNIIVKRYNDKYFNVVFPFQGNFAISTISHKLFWIPDFQNRYFPDFFSEKEAADRKLHQDSLAAAGCDIIFSSKNAQNDFSKFYPQSNSRTFVLRFASTHPEYRSLGILDLKKKFNITGDYFISPNQFWKHKNHTVVLKALKVLKESNVNAICVFTGKELDFRNPEYFDQLKKYVDENGLSSHVRFLGFIDRREQLKLMSEAIAVIQPSLFEGWSTVVEDAKEMNQFVLLSDIDVHKEQLDYNVSFFNPLKEEDLASKMIEVMKGNISRTTRDYSLNVRKFGSDFIKIVDEIISK